jgi:hypothetical protein
MKGVHNNLEAALAATSNRAGELYSQRERNALPTVENLLTPLTNRK